MTKALFTTAFSLAMALSLWAQTNVLSYPGFEGLSAGAIADNGGTKQWGNYNDTVGNCVVQSSIAHAGVNALELNVNPTGSQGYSIVYQNTGTSVPANLVQNTTWNYSFWVYTPSATGGSFNWAFFPSDSYNEDQAGASGTILASSLSAGAWTQVSGSFTSGTYSFNASATPEMKATFSAVNSTATFYIDDVVLTTNALPATVNTVPPADTTGVTVTVDPMVALTNYTGLGEWNTNGNFEAWTTAQVSGAAVSGGILSGAGSGSDPQVTLTGLSTNGPDLDLAFNDYLDVRLQVPSGFSGGIQVYFGATNDYYFTANATTGFDPNRAITITNVPSDGAFHVYRIFWGPHPYWRGNLSDVRIDPLGTAATPGQVFALDYVRVGDLTGDIYTPSYVAGTIPAPGVNSPNGYPVIDMSSKHFRFCWDISITSNSFWTADMPHKTLRNFEEVWKNHVWRIGFPEPSHPIGSKLPYNGQKRKINVTTWYGGYFTGGDGNNIPWVNITPDGLRTDPPTWVPPHEFTHACQESANTNGSQVVDGQFWENNANYGREQWLYHSPWETNQSGLDPYYADTSHFWLGHGRNYYLCWPFWLYLDENPDHLPGLGSSYGSFFSTKLWEYARPGEYLWDTLARLSPNNSVQDIIGYMARRNVMWDYSHRAAMTNAYNLGDMELAQRWTYAELRQRSDDPSWWQTPIEFAPQQSGYKIVRLIPQGTGAGRVVTVNFYGLPYTNGVRHADWRVSFVVVSDNGAVRYSNLWNAGTNSVTLAANENALYLSVAGTPNQFLAESIDDLAQPYQSSPAKARFPYEIQVTGAAPYESTNTSTAGLVQVANGGGWRATTATVDVTAYVGPNARVLGTAQVRNNARIEDYAIVEGSAQVLNNAAVSGHALVRNSAIVRDYAKVRDYAMVIDNSVVSGHARVLQHGEITAGSIITDWATVKGSASTWHDNTVATGPQAWNDAVLDGDFSTAQSVSNGFQFGFEEYNPGPLNWITNRTAPRRLYADYEFPNADNSLAKDFYGVTDGYLEGNPAWISSDGTRSGFLNFNGVNQYVILDQSLSDLQEISMTAWVKWSGGASNQPVWYFGSATNRCMFFTPDDGTGHAKFVIRTNSVEQTLVAASTLAPGVWTHVSVTLSNAQTGRLYINGILQQQGNITMTPDQLGAGDTNTAPRHNYLARGADATLPFFNGAVDSFKIYTGALTNGEIAAMQAANIAPTLAAISNRVIGADVTLDITSSASDADLPWQTLTFSLLNAPVGATINTNTGVFTWRPAVSQANTTNPVQIKVADNGTPSLSATQSFSIAVNPLAAPTLATALLTGGQFAFRVSGDSGPDYSIQTSTNLVQWATIFTTNSPGLPFNWVDPSPARQNKLFYRILLGP